MHAFFGKIKAAGRMEYLAAWGVKLSFQVNFLSERRMLNQLKGLISILLGSVQHLFR